MQINIKATKIELTPKIKDYIQEKVDMLEKFLGSVTVSNCDVEIALEGGGQTSGDIYRAELNIAVPGELLRVEKTEKDIFKAIDKVKDHMARSITRYKEKRQDKKRKAAIV
jgi:putative sigma-54 modulation protein